MNLLVLTDRDLEQRVAEHAKKIDAALAARERAVEEVGNCEKSAVISAWRLGGLLLEKKRRLKHGAFLPWLETAKIGERNAQQFMRLATQIRSESDLGPSIRATLRALLPPRTAPVEPAPVVGPIPDKDDAEIVAALEAELFKERDRASDREERIALMEEGASPDQRGFIRKINSQSELVRTLKASVAFWQHKCSDAQRQINALKLRIKELKKEREASA